MPRAVRKQGARSAATVYYVDKNGEGKPIKAEDESRLFDERTANLAAHLKELKNHPKTLKLTDIIERGEQRCETSFQLIDDHIVYWQGLAEVTKKSGNDVTVSDDRLHTLASCCKEHAIKGLTQCLTKNQ